MKLTLGSKNPQLISAADATYNTLYRIQKHEVAKYVGMVVVLIYAGILVTLQDTGITWNLDTLQNLKQKFLLEKFLHGESVTLTQE